MINSFLIPKPPLFSFQECLWFLDRGYDDCLFRVKNGQVLKAILVEGSPVVFAVHEYENNLKVNVLEGNCSKNGEAFIRQYLTEWFDLGKDLSPFYNLLNQDLRVAYMVENFNGLRLMGIEDLFEALCWSIIGQQINLNFAYKLKRKLVEAYGTKVFYEDEIFYLFPEPAVISRISIPDLKAMQFSESKAKYILEVARAFVENRLSKEILTALPDFEVRQKALIAIKGIGVWTANYVLMKTLRDASSIPFGDVGLLKALVSHQIITERKEVEKISAFFSNYKGWESYLVFYLWRSLSTPVFQAK